MPFPKPAGSGITSMPVIQIGVADVFAGIDKVNASRAVAIFYEACLRYTAAGTALAMKYMAKSVQRERGLDDTVNAIPLTEAEYSQCFNELVDVPWSDGFKRHVMALGADPLYGELVGPEVVAKSAKVWDFNFYLGVAKGFMRGAELSRVDTTYFVSATDYNFLYAARIGVKTMPPAARAPFLEGSFSKTNLAPDGSYVAGSSGLMAPGIYVPRARWKIVQPKDKPKRAVVSLYGEGFGNTGVSVFCDFARPREYGANASILVQNNPDGTGLPENETGRPTQLRGPGL